MDAHGEEDDGGELHINHLIGILLSAEDANNLEEAAYQIYKGLHDAIINDDVTMVHNCAITGISLDQHFDESINEQHAGITPLALACALNKPKAVKILVDNDADINLPFAALNTTALMTSAYHGHFDIVRMLVQHGADVQAEDLQKSTALGYAFGGNRNVDVIKLLLQSKINVNHKNVLGMNALLLVSGYGDPALVDLVLQYGADPKSVNDYGHTALHLAVDGKNNMVKRIMTDASITDHNAHRGPLDSALKEWCKKHSELVGGPNMDEGALDEAGELLLAVSENYKEMIAQADGDDMSTQDRKIKAMYTYRQKRLQQAKESKKGGIMGLLSCGGGKSDKAKKTKGSKPLEGGPQGDVPPPVREELARVSLAFARILKQLLNAGCEREGTDHTFGMTALDLAVIHADVESTAVLTGAGADPHHFIKMIALRDFYQSVKRGQPKEMKEQLHFDDDLDINYPFPNNIVMPESREGGMTPFALVCSQHDLETAKGMIKKGARINEGGPSGRFPLTEAASNNDLKLGHVLLINGANLDVPSKAYQEATPVTVAAIHNNKEMVDFLIKKGAKVDKPMSDGRNTLLVTHENQNLEIMNMILSANLQNNFSTQEGFVVDSCKYYQSPDSDMEVILQQVQNVYGKTMEENRIKAEKEKEELGERPGEMIPTRTGALIVEEKERPPAERLQDSPPAPSRPAPTRPAPSPGRDSPASPPRSIIDETPPATSTPESKPEPPSPLRERVPVLAPRVRDPSPVRQPSPVREPSPLREPSPIANHHIDQDSFIVYREKSTDPEAHIGRVTETTTTETRMENGVERRMVVTEKVTSSSSASSTRWGSSSTGQPMGPTSPSGPPPPLPASLPPPPPGPPPAEDEEEEEESGSEEEESESEEEESGSEEEESEEEEEEEEEKKRTTTTTTVGPAGHTTMTTTTTTTRMVVQGGGAPKATADDEDEEETDEEESEEEESEEEESEEESESEEEEEAPKADVNRNKVNATANAKPAAAEEDSNETEV